MSVATWIALYSFNHEARGSILAGSELDVIEQGILSNHFRMSYDGLDKRKDGYLTNKWWFFLNGYQKVLRY